MDNLLWREQWYFVAVALWRYCGMVVLQLRCGDIVEWLCCSCVVAVLWCSCILVRWYSFVFCAVASQPCLYFAQWYASHVYIFAQWYFSCVCVFVQQYSSHVYIFAQWYSSTNALKMQAFCFKWLMRVIYFTNFVKTNAIR